MQSCGPISRPPPGFGAKYFFPPPWLLWAADSKRRDQYVHNYIRIRDHCLRRHFSEDFEELPRRTEYWKEALKGNYKQSNGLDIDMATQPVITMNDTLPPTSSTIVESSKRGPRKVLRAFARTDFGCNGELQPWKQDMVVNWQGNEVRYPDDISTRLRQEVQFELYELNWRAELLALDLKVTHNKNSAIDHVAKRKEIVGRVWNKTSTGVILFPNNSADYFNVWSDNNDDISRSREALQNLHAVLESWPDFPSDLFGKDVFSMNTIQRHHLSKDLFRFYTKTFHAQYSRLPILPRSLPKLMG